MPTEGTTRTRTLTASQVSIVKQALADALELYEMIEDGNKVHTSGDSERGRIVELGRDITDLVRRKQRQYKALLTKLLEGR